MKSKPFKKMPSELYDVVQLFSRAKVDYLLFKCEHVFEGENKNLDVLLRTKEDYARASTLLAKVGYFLYMPEGVEKYKRMFCRFEKGKVFAVHLHREVAWHGMIALNKEPLFSQKRTIANAIVVPSPEDSILIHAAHILFENFSIGKREKVVFKEHLCKNLGWEYINKHAGKKGWKKELHLVLQKYAQKKEIPMRVPFVAVAKHLIAHPITIAYISLKVARFILRKISLRRRGTLISFIGVNGSGKTTMTSSLLEEYKGFAHFLGIKAKGYYFGWRPFSFVAKIISSLFKRKQVFKKVAEERKDQSSAKQRLSLFSEALLFYNLCEYFLRYTFEIYPKLRRRELVVTDRYFYDVYGQYPYAPKSYLLSFLFKLFPKPDFVFILDATLQGLQNRSKATKTYEGGEKQGTRNVKSDFYLQGQIERYRQFAKIHEGRLHLVNHAYSVDRIIENISQRTWKRIARKLR